MDTCRHGRRGSGSSLFGVNTASGCLRRVLCHYVVNHSLVATHLTSQDKYGLRTRPGSMKQKITGFDQDDEDHWRAILECGHRQHLRHDPPMTIRTWVLTEEGRASRIGFELDCKRCDEEPGSLNE